MVEQRVGRSALDDLAEVHHRDAIADVPDDVQVVRDEDESDPQPLAQLFEQVDYLRLDRRIERRDGLVGDQHLRADRERARDADALALAAAQRVRQVVLQPRREADRQQQLVDPVGALAARRRQRMHLQHFAERLRQAHARIERRVRVLEHHLDTTGALQRRAAGRHRLALPADAPFIRSVDPAQAAR